MSALPEPLPPKPVGDLDTQAFWDGVGERRLLVQRCDACSRWVWQPKPVCPFCRTSGPAWHEVTGAGRVASWTVLHPPVLPVWTDQLPFVVLLVELDEGVRMMGQLVDDDGELVRTDGEPEGVAFDAPVGLRWRVDEAGQILPAWTIAR